MDTITIYLDTDTIILQVNHLFLEETPENDEMFAELEKNDQYPFEVGYWIGQDEWPVGWDYERDSPNYKSGVYQELQTVKYDGEMPAKIRPILEAITNLDLFKSFWDSELQMKFND